MFGRLKFQFNSFKELLILCWSVSKIEKVAYGFNGYGDVQFYNVLHLVFNVYAIQS